MALCVLEKKYNILQVIYYKRPPDLTRRKGGYKIRGLRTAERGIYMATFTTGHNEVMDTVVSGTDTQGGQFE